MPKAGDIPVCPKPPVARSSGRTTKEYRISVVTPLFGGGVEAGEPDETLPIRGTSIRGQLQFWWRGTRGAGFSTREELFARHAEVWGTAERASPVEMDIRNVVASQERSCASYEWNPKARQGQGGWRLIWDPLFAGSLPYVLFPFQGQQPRSRHESAEEAPAHFIETASFRARFRYPASLREDVETAVWAWVNFGGLGARTRRGCGALLCEELAPRGVNDLQRWFRNGSLNGERNVRDWPTMSTSILIGSPPEASLDAWKRIIGLLQAFRQGEGIARNPKTQGEPPDTVLYPSCGPNGDSRERMASPLILKPLVLADGKAVPLIMQLVTPGLVGVDLKQGNKSLNLPKTTEVRAGRLATYRDSPLAGSASGSAVEAFLSHARQNGFREITR